MEKRQLYHFAGSIPCPTDNLNMLRGPNNKRQSAKSLADQMAANLYNEEFIRDNKEALDALPRPLDDDSFIVQIMKVNYGKGTDNPVDLVRQLLDLHNWPCFPNDAVAATEGFDRGLCCDNVL